MSPHAAELLRQACAQCRNEVSIHVQQLSTAKIPISVVVSSIFASLMHEKYMLLTPLSHSQQQAASLGEDIQLEKLLGSDFDQVESTIIEYAKLCSMAVPEHLREEMYKHVYEQCKEGYETPT